MEWIYQFALIVHIIAGMTALVAGLIAIISRKGMQMHKASGLVFFWGMMLVCISAIYISLLKNIPFLLHIGIFAFFMVFGGYRTVKNKSLLASTVDWLILLVGLVNGLLMVYSLKIVLMVFGIIGCYLAISDVRLFLLAMKDREFPRNQWLIRHIGLMLGAYISTATAFLVVNVSLSQFAWIPWLVPTIIGTPLIAYWTNRFSSKSQSIKS